MGIRNTDLRYGWLSMLFHWVMAGLIIFMLALGLYMVDLPKDTFKLKLFGWHKQTGILILMLVALRIVWRMSNARPLLTQLPAWERNSAILMHWLLYALMFAIPLSGWLMSSAAGVSVSFFGYFIMPNIISPDKPTMHLLAQTHNFLAYVLMAAITLHVLAALKHHFIDRDDILRRML